MSEENLELARRTIDAVNARDLEALLALADEEVESFSRIVALEGPLRGHEGIRRWWDGWFSAFPDYTIEIIEMNDHGDVVIAAIRAIGHGAGSDLPFEDVVWHASRWRDGKFVWWQVCSTHDEALKAAGLAE